MVERVTQTFEKEADEKDFLKNYNEIRRASGIRISGAAKSDENGATAITVLYENEDGTNGKLEVLPSQLRNRTHLLPRLLNLGCLIPAGRKKEEELLNRLTEEANDLLSQPEKLRWFTTQVGWTTDGQA